jgi:hypothetical protein
MKKLNLLLSLFLLLTLSLHANTWYVKLSGSGAWANKPAEKLVVVSSDNLASEWMNASHKNDTLWIATGTYNLSEMIIMGENQVVFGSFKGDENDISSRARRDMDGNGLVETWEFENPTILEPTQTYSATGAGRALVCNSTSNNAYVDGIVFQNFHHSLDNSSNLFVNNSTAKLKNIVLRNSTITSSSAPLSGVIKVTLGVVENSLVEFCSAEQTGGKICDGVFHVNSSGTAIGCVSRGNWVSGSPAYMGQGGGFSLDSKSAGAKLINCVAHNNFSSGPGGGIQMNTSLDKIINCTVVNNISGNNHSAGINMKSGGYCYNCVAWGNTGTAALSADIVFASAGTPTAPIVYHINNVAGNRLKNGSGWGDDAVHFPELFSYLTITIPEGILPTGRPSNTIDKLAADPPQYAPKFANPSAFQGCSQSGLDFDSNKNPSQQDIDAIRTANFSLTAESPLVDKGSESYIDVTTDLLGKERTYGLTTDIGAYEYNGDNTDVHSVKINAKVFVSNGKCTIDGVSGCFDINLFSINGKRILSKKSLSGTVSLNVDKKGVYLLQIVNKNISETLKIFL